jgi:hypothetical protein
MNSRSEQTNWVYTADTNTSSYDMFWVIGVIATGPTATVAGTTQVQLTSLGSYTLGSADSPLSIGTIGQPLWLGAGGAWTTTVNSAAGFACSKVGMVQSASQIWVMPQVMGVV